MGLEAIKDQLNSGKDEDGNVVFLVNDDWDTVVEEWASRIALYRLYVKGDQRLELTDKMAGLLGITKEEGERFSLNYCKTIRDKLANRLKMIKMRGDDEGSTEWADKFAKDARFDGLQIDVYKAAVGEGDTFLMVDPLPLETGDFPGLVKESAYNGHTGVIAVYDVTKRFIVAVVKIWDDPAITDENKLRANIYYDDRIEMFTYGDELEAYVDPKTGKSTIEWIGNKSKKPLGVSFFHFKNEAETGTETGQSHIKSVVSAQDGINRSGLDVIGAAGLTAAPLKYGIGVSEKWSGEIVVGGMVFFEPGGAPDEKHKPEVGTFAQGETGPIIEAADFFIEQAGSTTSTPLPDTMGSSASSGEALKVRDADQVSMAEVLQTKFGNVLEDVFGYANMLQNELGNKAPPESESWDAKWKSAQTRSDADIIKSVVAIKDFLPYRIALEEIGKITTFQWDKARIDEIMEEQRKENDRINNVPINPGSNPSIGNPTIPPAGSLNTLLGQIGGAGNAVVDAVTD